MITGIICEYNPLHNGHAKQLRILKNADPEGTTVCLMSGNFVQRGHPAIFHRTVRAQAALQAGADLVLELPVTYALSSAEGFASGGVSILGKFCHQLCFGAETPDAAHLYELAHTLCSPEFSEQLRPQLDKGLSFPAARQLALEALQVDSSPLNTPNNILAVEYCKAIISQKSEMKPYVISRCGDYHAPDADLENPSATALRQLMIQNEPWEAYTPVPAIFRSAPVHHIQAGERAILARLRTMTDAEFEALPYGSEGLWRKLMHASRKGSTLEEILNAVKSKRYTRSRLDRMVMCAFLGITQKDLQAPAPYTRILAFNEKGRQLLNDAKKELSFLNIGQATNDPYELLEQRCDDLYGLFCREQPGQAGTFRQQRVIYGK